MPQTTVDLIIINAQIYNSFSKKFIKNNLVVKQEKVLYIGQNIQEFTSPHIVDAQNNYLIPGLIDIHMHIESTMATPQAFAHELARHGVTTIISEPHEIANVFGRVGVESMLAASENAPIDIFFGVPSSVPSTNSDLESTGGEITLEDLQILLKQPQVVCLGEIMNYVDVIYREQSKTLDLINYTKANYPYLAIEGHCPRIGDVELAKMLFAGVHSDHTQQTVAGLIDRFLQGMFVEIQSKSLKADIIACIQEYQMYERLALVTDDIMADEFVSKGQLDKNLRKLIQLGVKPELAIYLATYTPALHIGWRDRGCLAAGKIADFFITDNLTELPILATYKNGKKIYDHTQEYIFPAKSLNFPSHFYQSVHCQPLTAQQLQIPVKTTAASVRCNVFELVADATFTQAKQADIPVKAGLLDWQASAYALALVLERHGRGQLQPALALVGGVCLQSGAIATTYAHDHHNLLAIGRNIPDLLFAVNRVIEQQGAYLAVLNETILAEVPLPIAGILSPLSMPELALEVQALKQAFAQLGYAHKNPLMSLSTISLPVSPELKLTDKGLIEVKSQTILPLIVK